MAKPAKPALVCMIELSLVFLEMEDLQHRKVEVVFYDTAWLAVDRPIDLQSLNLDRRNRSDRV